VDCGLEIFEKLPPDSVSCAMLNDLGGPWQSARTWKLLKNLILNAPQVYDTITTRCHS